MGESRKEIEKKNENVLLKVVALREELRAALAFSVRSQQVAEAMLV